MKNSCHTGKLSQGLYISDYKGLSQTSNFSQQGFLYVKFKNL